MRRSLLVLLAIAAVAAGGTALAQTGSDDPYNQPEPKVTSSVFRLASDDGCLGDRRLLVRFAPPSGAVFGWLEVTVRGHRAVRMTGVPRAASATVLLPRGTSHVRVLGETLGGQRVRAFRTYTSCDAQTSPSSGGGGGGTPIQQGGGED